MRVWMEGLDDFDIKWKLNVALKWMSDFFIWFAFGFLQQERAKLVETSTLCMTASTGMVRNSEP